MSRKTCAFVVSALVVFVWFGGSGRSRGQGQGVPTPFFCGDSNGDGQLDISDSVHTLNFLFMGGPEPQCALASCTPPLGNICDEINELKARTADVSARVRNGAAGKCITVQSNEEFPVQFPDEEFDTANLHASGDTRLVAPVPGKYLLTGAIRFQNQSTSGSRQVIIRINGSRDYAVETRNANTIFPATDITISTIVELDDGDYAELVVVQTSGVPIRIESATYRSPEFAIARLP